MGLDNPLHILFLVLILLLVFGAKRIPEIGRSLGTGMREFKHSVTGESHEPPQATLAASNPPQQAASPPAPAPAQAEPAAVVSTPAASEPEHSGAPQQP
jgi:sec-independent protein translocase protein TatA